MYLCITSPNGMMFMNHKETPSRDEAIQFAKDHQEHTWIIFRQRGEKQQDVTIQLRKE